MFNININENASLTAYLKKLGWLRNDEEILEVSKPGEGNMNLVLRIRTATRSFILKQSRDYVEKYPQVPAPANRALVEGAFYEKIQSDEVISQLMPQLMGMDSSSHVLLLEDLGPTRDYSFLYQGNARLSPEEIGLLTSYLSRLHGAFYQTVPGNELLNLAMCQLNHEHLFQYPFVADNGLNLDGVLAGLQQAAAPYQADQALKEKIAQLGEWYLSPGHALLHGDFYPGSWVNSPQGLKIIDPEFCFFGPPEFDLGVMMAHLKITGHEPSLIDYVRQHYQAPEPIDQALLQGFTGVEIMRRLIGLAQLPLQLDLSARKHLLAEAYQLIMHQ
jgi:5-methylthioribose kinase